MTSLPEILKNNWARDVDRLFDQLGLPVARRSEPDLTRYGFNPVCEVNEDKTNYYLRFDLPGIPKEQIKIDLHDKQLTVSGERKIEKTENKRQHFSEVFYGSFSRSLTFPAPVDAAKVVATYENGILTISVPKSERAGATQIPIQ